MNMMDGWSFHAREKPRETSRAPPNHLDCSVEDRTLMKQAWHSLQSLGE